jgi:DNA modification methylase
MTQLKFETWPIERLIEYARNPRKNDHAVDKIAGAIKEFGFRIPVVAKSDGLVVDGHLRLKAAKKLGLTEVPVILADDMTEAQIKAFRISVNRMAEFAEWDNELLTLEFSELQGMDFDLDLTGFTADEIAALMPEEIKPGKTDEDAVPEVPEQPVTVLGDVWVMGKHRLMCGNSTMLADVERLMNGTTPDCIHTDPPYGMNAVSKSSVLKKNYKQDIMGDDTPDVAKDAFRLIYGMWPDAKQIWWGANYYCSVLPDSECWLVWDKNNGQSDQTDCELAWANFRSVVRQFTLASEKTNRVHPTQKPVALMEWILKRFNLSVKTVADFFGGSGSTLIAAEKHGAQAFIMEFDPRFADVIVKRWQDFTGKIAVHAETGQPFAEVTHEKQETSH